MAQHRDDQDMPNRQSNMEKAEGSRERDGASDMRNSETRSDSSRSVLSDEQTFEEGMDPSVVRGMSEAGRERMRGSDARGSERSDSRERPRETPERGRSGSER